MLKEVLHANHDFPETTMTIPLSPPLRPLRLQVERLEDRLDFSQDFPIFRRKEVIVRYLFAGIILLLDPVD
ncbi:hypothetical protein CMUS01_16760, partial [Colletotrichum musicola]